MPGMPPAAQAQVAFANAQAQSMMMTNQAQLQGMIAMQSAMLTNATARGIFLAQAASLQVHTMNNQNMMFVTHNASLFSAQQSLMLQQQMQAHAAILRMRSQGIDNAASIQHAVQLAMLDPLKLGRQTAMVRAAAARASGQAASSQATSPAAAPDANLPVEPPPMMIRPTFGNSFTVEKPKFSVESGKVAAGTKVKIKSETHYVTLYYTTNGWTPTTQSAKYTGPIAIDGNTHLQVIAMGPNFMRSAVEHADYEVPGAPAHPPETTVTVPADGTLHAGTPLRVAFAGKDIDSETASVGDEIKLVLDVDIKLGDTVLAPKGAAVDAALTMADPGHGPAPGDLVFEIHSIEIAGKRVPLFGGETLEGVKGGKNAVIKPGMTALAFVSADVALR